MKNKPLQLSEDSECFALVEYLDILVNQRKLVGYTHVPNETYIKSFAGRARRKALGMKAGFPDYMIFTSNKTIFIEMKKEKGGVVTPEQREWHTLLTIRTSHNYAYIAHGFEAAKNYIDALL